MTTLGGLAGSAEIEGEYAATTIASTAAVCNSVVIRCSKYSPSWHGGTASVRVPHSNRLKLAGRSLLAEAKHAADLGRSGEPRLDRCTRSAQERNHAALDGQLFQPHTIAA